MYSEVPPEGSAATTAFHSSVVKHNCTSLTTYAGLEGWQLQELAYLIFCCICGTRCTPDLLHSVRLQLEVLLSLAVHHVSM